ncbi:concanavalin A-like lectin/glucanase domain-containing protein [Papiliotrema laurentii]|uniref:Concanavalin A-like lectin/glucanase domain-containing protein n=1 Tax=Papiliotrema laurentii TaxID=5418 RepID=A0AAD9FQB4_PAPLA|nr:concanavalin A-like lectin/glucanase domain-containing protein [Papiliotrema laurentii]
MSFSTSGVRDVVGLPISTDRLDFFSDADPTNGYVNYVSKSDSQSLGLASKLQDGSFIMRADAENRSVGRGRNSVRISSKASFGDGVYILDMNHMPVGCGTWPAWWTVVKNGWPKGGEIDIIEGANAYPSLNSASYNATSSVGLKTPVAGCNLDPNAYMTGTVGSTTCSAYQNGNTGCGAYLGGKSTYGTTSFGSGVNEAGGGWFAMWRDIEASGGVYVYYWPRNASNVPDDVRYPNTSTTNVANWGQPGANLSVPTCKNDFGNHVIVFNLAFCGDYAGNTYAQSGCPQVCSSFVQNYPEAFGEAYWSINSLRVYTTSGKPASGGSGLSGGAIAGIVVGVIVALGLAAFAFWRWKRSRRAK